MKSPRHPRYARHRFPAEVISHAVWLYFRFPLSLRMVEEMLAARGIEVSHETVRQWALKFGQSLPRRSAGVFRHRETNGTSMRSRSALQVGSTGSGEPSTSMGSCSTSWCRAAAMQSRQALLRKLLKKQGIGTARDDHRQAGQLRRRKEESDARRGASAA